MDKDIRFDAISILIEIAEYHKQLGLPRKTKNLDEQMTEAREAFLAMQVEVVEALNCLPWKTWKAKDNQPQTYSDLSEELADIVFFLSSILEIFNIAPATFIHTIIKKLYKNKRRLEKDGDHKEVKPI